jgi:hypothetical protein
LLFEESEFIDPDHPTGFVVPLVGAFDPGDFADEKCRGVRCFGPPPVTAMAVFGTKQINRNP